MSTTRTQRSVDDIKEVPTIAETLERIPHLINKDDVMRMINLQVNAIDRLEGTNKSLVNCNNSAQMKLTSTTKLFKKTTKQMKDTKKDLDVIYKKLNELKAKIRAERPDLFATERQQEQEQEFDLQLQAQPTILDRQIQSQPTDIDRKISR